MISRFASAVMLAATFTSPALAAPCLSIAETRAIVAYMAPPVLSGAAKTCATVTPGGFLASPAVPALVGQYQQIADRDWPQAKSAIIKLVDEGGSSAKVLGALSDKVLRELVNVSFVAAFANDIKVGDCPIVDRLVSTLSRIAPDDATDLLANLMAMTKGGKFDVCKAG